MTGSVKVFGGWCVRPTLSKEPYARFFRQPATPAPFWPQLSLPARRAMLAAGLAVEAQKVDEELFANWLVSNLEQVQVAVNLVRVVSLFLIGLFAQPVGDFL